MQALVVSMALLQASSPTPAAAPLSDSCGRVASLTLPQAKVTSAEVIAAGAMTPPTDRSPWLRGDPALYRSLPAFCRVQAKATPSADSAISIEVWLPVEKWNGKLRGVGNGGFAGEIDAGTLASAVLQGYASAGTDTGHTGQGTDARWALGHPEKVTDFGYRAVHLMTETAKAAIQAYYGRPPAKSYFMSCSNGGRQALMEVQRFPGDYDGVVAGAPAYHWTHLLTKALADAQATTLDPASYIPPRKLPAIAKAANAACDARDGVADGVIADPPRCRFDPADLLCRDGESDTCLGAAQVTALRALYAGPRDARGERIFPGYLPGAEEGSGGWGPWITGAEPGKSLLFAFGVGYFSNIVYEKADWDYRTANVDAALRAAVEKTAHKLDATEANLSAFKARGGKLILYHGWNDPAISATSTVEYFDRVVGRMGKAETESFLRMYLAPGMQHCFGGPGPNAFGQDGGRPREGQADNVLAVLERWVEAGIAPTTIVATRFADDGKGVHSTRPLCPHPQVAKYKGQGDPNQAASFACAPPGP